MAALEPTYYDIDNLSQTGMHQGDVVRAIYNLWKAIDAICTNVDEDVGNIGQDYMSKIGTDLNTAMARLVTPKGPTT